MASNFTDIGQLRFWCQKILPLVYDDSLSYYELLCKVVEKLNLVIQNVDGLPEYIGELISEDKIKPILDALIDDLRSNIAKVNEKDSPTATADRHTGELLWWKDNLYEVVRDMNIGDAYIDYSSNPNIKHVTVEELINNLRDNIVNIIEPALNDIRGEIAQEVIDRQDGDDNLRNDLQGNIDAEATARENADNVLQGNIDAEATARENADNAEATARENADNSLSDMIKDKPYINVKDYGAIGDGVADDSNAFINAIADATNMGKTVIVPNGTYNLSTDVVSSTDTFRLLQGDEVYYTGAGAGNPNYPTLDGKLQSLYCQPGNKVIEDITRFHKQPVSPAGNGTCVVAREWVADSDTETNDYITITGTIRNGSSTMTVSSTEGIAVGSGVLLVSPTNPDFPSGETKQNTVRVCSVDANTNTITIGFPSANPTAWAGIADASPWNGSDIINGTFKIRRRYWNVTEFIGAVSGKGNIDRIAYGMNVVTGSYGNLTYGIELDQDFGDTQQPNEDIIHKGIYILGFGKAQPLNRALQIEHSGSNYRVGVKILNCYNGFQINAKGGIDFDKVFHNRLTGTDEPVEYGMRTSDLTDLELVAVLPTYASSQIVNGSSIVYLKRNLDNGQQGNYIKCVDATGNGVVFAIDVNGVINISPSLFANEQVTPTHSITVKSADGHTFKIPAQQID